MPTFLSQNCDYAVFAAATLGAFAALAWVLARVVKGARLPTFIWVLVGLVLIGGWWRVLEAGDSVRQQIARLVSAMTPTYARELARAGHAQLTLETRTDDPLFQRLLQMQREWLAENRGAHDIYTMRLLPDGRRVFMVDADTDYNRDGIITENERGATLGQEYDVADEGLNRALRGQANFDFEPITDQWGTWVGAWAPIRNAAGNVEAVVGVDYKARDWFAAIAAARVRQASPTTG